MSYDTSNYYSLGRRNISSRPNSYSSDLSYTSSSTYGSRRSYGFNSGYSSMGSSSLYTPSSYFPSGSSTSSYSSSSRLSPAMLKRDSLIGTLVRSSNDLSSHHFASSDTTNYASSRSNVRSYGSLDRSRSRTSDLSLSSISTRAGSDLRNFSSFVTTSSYGTTYRATYRPVLMERPTFVNFTPRSKEEREKERTNKSIRRDRPLVKFREKNDGSNPDGVRQLLDAWSPDIIEEQDEEEYDKKKRDSVRSNDSGIGSFRNSLVRGSCRKSVEFGNYELGPTIDERDSGTEESEGCSANKQDELKIDSLTSVDEGVHLDGDEESRLPRDVSCPLEFQENLQSSEANLKTSSNFSTPSSYDSASTKQRRRRESHLEDEISNSNYLRRKSRGGTDSVENTENNSSENITTKKVRGIYNVDDCSGERLALSKTDCNEKIEKKILTSDLGKSTTEVKCSADLRSKNLTRSRNLAVRTTSRDKILDLNVSAVESKSKEVNSESSSQPKTVSDHSESKTNCDNIRQLSSVNNDPNNHSPLIRTSTELIKPSIKEEKSQLSTSSCQKEVCAILPVTKITDDKQVETENTLTDTKPAKKKVIKKYDGEVRQKKMKKVIKSGETATVSSVPPASASETIAVDLKTNELNFKGETASAQETVLKTIKAENFTDIPTKECKANEKISSTINPTPNKCSPTDLKTSQVGKMGSQPASILEKNSSVTDAKTTNRGILKNSDLKTPNQQASLTKHLPSPSQNSEKDSSKINVLSTHFLSKGDKSSTISKITVNVPHGLSKEEIRDETGDTGKEGKNATKVVELSGSAVKPKTAKDVVESVVTPEVVAKVVSKEISTAKDSEGDETSKHSPLLKDSQTALKSKGKKDISTSVAAPKTFTLLKSKTVKSTTESKDIESNSGVRSECPIPTSPSGTKESKLKEPKQLSTDHRGKIDVKHSKSGNVSASITGIDDSNKKENSEKSNQLTNAHEIQSYTSPSSPIKLELTDKAGLSQSELSKVEILGGKEPRVESGAKPKTRNEKKENLSVLPKNKISTLESSAVETLKVSQPEKQTTDSIILDLPINILSQSSECDTKIPVEIPIDITHKSVGLPISETTKESTDRDEVSEGSKLPNISQLESTPVNPSKVSACVFPKAKVSAEVPIKICKSSSEDFNRTTRVAEKESSSVNAKLQKSSSADLGVPKCTTRLTPIVRPQHVPVSIVPPGEVLPKLAKRETDSTTMTNKLQKSSTTEFVESLTFEAMRAHGLRKSRTHEFPSLVKKPQIRDPKVLKNLKLLPPKPERSRLQAGVKTQPNLTQKTSAIEPNELETNKIGTTLPALSVASHESGSASRVLDNETQSLISEKEATKVVQSENLPIESVEAQTHDLEIDSGMKSVASKELTSLKLVDTQGEVHRNVDQSSRNETKLPDISLDHSQIAGKPPLHKAKQVDLGEALPGDKPLRTLMTSRSDPNLPDRRLKQSSSDPNVPRSIVEKPPRTKFFRVPALPSKSPVGPTDGNLTVVPNRETKHLERPSKQSNGDLILECLSEITTVSHLLTDESKDAQIFKESEDSSGIKVGFQNNSDNKKPMVESNSDNVIVFPENVSNSEVKPRNSIVEIDEARKPTASIFEASEKNILPVDNHKDNDISTTIAEGKTTSLTSSITETKDATELQLSESKVEDPGKSVVDVKTLESDETKTKKKKVKKVDDKGEKPKRKKKKKPDVQDFAEEVREKLVIEQRAEDTSATSSKILESEIPVVNATTPELSGLTLDQHSKGTPIDDTVAICSECKTNCHKKCEKSVPHLCGVNEKLLSEVLATVKKDIASPSVATPSDTQSATEIFSNDSLSRSPPLSPVNSDPDNACDPFGENRRSESTDSFRSSGGKTLHYRKYSIDDFHLLKVLGRGSYGKVMLSEMKGHNEYFAIKCLKKDVVLEDNDVECTMIEKKVLTMGTNHPYLCTLFCTFQSDSHLFFVMEYLSGGDLMFHIQQSGRFDQERARFYSAEIICALKYLHKRGIVYRDAKLDNICLDVEGHIRLVDFGFCKLRIYRKECLPKNLCGTPDYMAPEIIKGQHYNQSVDWWSFGVLLYEMLIGQSPFNGTDEEELFWSVCNEEAYYPRFISKEAKQLLVMLLEKIPEKRLGMPGCQAGDICTQPFFRLVNWEKVERKEMEPPFKPKLKSDVDVSNFDSDFTMEKAMLTPMDKQILASMDQSQFQGFSYTNPNITD